MRQVKPLFILVILLLGVWTLAAQSKEKNKILFLFGGDIFFGETYQAKLEKDGKTNILKTHGYD